MNYIDIYDFIERLLKYRIINKHTISLLNIEHKSKALSLLRWCMDNNVVEEHDNEIKLIKPVELLISLPFFGIIPDRFSAYIEWHEFEHYISQVFTKLNWYVYLNYKHTKVDRFQVDVIAINEELKISLFIECKHWKNVANIYYNIDKIVEHHKKRVEKYLRHCEWVCVKIPKLRDTKYILPVIIILNDLASKVYNGIPVVSVFKLLDFAVNIDSYIDALNLKLYKNRCYRGL